MHINPHQLIHTHTYINTSLHTHTYTYIHQRHGNRTHNALKALHLDTLFGAGKGSTPWCTHTRTHTHKFVTYLKPFKSVCVCARIAYTLTYIHTYITHTLHIVWRRIQQRTHTHTHTFTSYTHIHSFKGVCVYVRISYLNYISTCIDTYMHAWICLGAEIKRINTCIQT